MLKEFPRDLKRIGAGGRFRQPTCLSASTRGDRGRRALRVIGAVAFVAADVAVHDLIEEHG